MKSGQIRMLGRSWNLSWTNGTQNFNKKFKVTQDLVDFANTEEISIMNKVTLTLQYRNQLKF